MCVPRKTQDIVRLARLISGPSVDSIERFLFGCEARRLYFADISLMN